jgi:hypothetical protein
MIASPDLTNKILQSYLFTAKDKQALANALAHGYLLAKAKSYQRAQSSVGAIVRIRHPWAVGPSDVKRAQSWATEQVDGIAETYETLLKHAIEDMPTERSIGDIIGGVKQVVANIGEWISGFLPWKTDQIAGSVWGSGESDGTTEWIDDATDPDGIDGIITNIRVMVLPASSSKDACELIAGMEFALSDAPRLPMHPNCVHHLEVISV